MTSLISKGGDEGVGESVDGAVVGDGAVVHEDGACTEAAR